MSGGACQIRAADGADPAGGARQTNSRFYCRNPDGFRSRCNRLRDGTEAVALLAIGPIEVLVTDLMLRDDEGLTLSRHCAARGIPTITLTGYEFHIDPAEQDRPLPLVEKPFRLDDLQCVIDAVAVAAGSTRAAA